MTGKEELGRWVSYQRSSRNQKALVLTEKRIELLDKLGFVWCAMPDGWTPPPPGGEPRQNRAIAAKMVYPDLTYREALLLGGYEDEELDVVKNPKHMWRTGERSFVSSTVTTTADVFLFRVCSTLLLMTCRFPLLCHTML